MTGCSLRLLCVLSVCSILTSGGLAQSGIIPLKNPGFETAGSGALPDRWALVEPPSPAGADVGADRSISHTGSASLRIAHREPGRTILASDPITLQVGKLYRLSGWIRTDRAFADPTSRYPTAVSATLTMSSFPFTNHSPVVGGTHEWTRVEVLFFATRKEDRVRVHFGANGTAAGTAWFDDLTVEEVNDITQYVPLETVTWFGPAFRYSDRGWIFVHCEGEPYQRGYQYGYLLAKEISAYIDKLAIRQNTGDPKAGWAELRTLTDALMLRKYDGEYLEEMRGIADGAAKGGAVFSGRTVDFLDLVTVNSVVDIGQLSSALNETPHALSGRSFRAEQDEMNALERLHKCSSFLANGSATKDGRIVFGQLFMWSGYTGVHWDVICDIVPPKGHRLVYQTFPGGIHSGADFYINSAGIMLGETTVMQTPFEMHGEPQSSRIRKAAQYASSIDDAVRILTTNNNGLYTNDWLIGDVRKNEIAILLLGTKKYKVWRSSKGDYPGGTEGFLWSVNNAKDPEVRKEYVPDPSNAPFDVVYSNTNRDLSFYRYYQKEKGNIDAMSAVNVLATSPINRPHACDGKVTDSEMASNMMFLAHYGKVTLREKFPEKTSRFLPDLPNAVPHLTLGYSVVNPVYVADQLKKLKPTATAAVKRETKLASAKEVYEFDKKLLWINTVYPETAGDNWFVSGTAAYYGMMNGLPADARSAASSIRDQFAEMNCRLLYTMQREGSIAPGKAAIVYDRYNNYLIPRIRGTYLLHQLRILLGNEVFSKVLNGVHAEWRDKPMSTVAFIRKAEEVSKQSLKPFVMQWVEREDLPDPEVRAKASQVGGEWTVTVEVRQAGKSYDFFTTVGIETDAETTWEIMRVSGDSTQKTVTCRQKPRRVVFNCGNDIPVRRDAYYTLSNLFDDFQRTAIVYGTSRQIEAHHTLALRYQSVLADAFTEILPPLRLDAEVSPEDAKQSDLVLLSVGTDNSMVQQLAETMGIEVGKNMFRWNGKTYGSPEDGILVVCPNPADKERVVYMLLANSAMQLYNMTKRHQPLPSWGVFRGDQLVERGFHPVKRFEIGLSGTEGLRAD